MSSSNSNDYVMEIKTIQIAPIRMLFIALKDILVQTNIVFQEDGIRITSMDNSKIILAHLNLDASNFEQFNIQYPKITIGVTIFQLFRIINTLEPNDTLTMFIEKQHYSGGFVSHLGLRFENGDIGQNRLFYLSLIEPDPQQPIMPEIEYSSIINLPSTDFQKIVRDLSVLDTKIEIKSVGDEIIFSVKGPFAEAHVSRSECDANLNYLKKDELEVIQGVFSLKYLNYFIKCTGLCNNIELMLGNDMPLIVKYNVASLGDIKLCLAPCHD